MTRPPTVVHVSWLSREGPDASPGGVEKFAWYLKGALSQLGWQVIIISWRDMPNAERYDRQGISNPDKALVLGAWLDGPAFGVAFDVAVSDGYWGLGVTSHPVVPVVHGTWAEFHERMGMTPGLEVQRQGEAFNAPNAYPVACSPASARELRRHHGRTAAATIYHGIDLSLFRPRHPPLPPGPPWVVLQAAGKNVKKGARILPTIAAQLGPDFSVEYLAAGIGEEAEAFRRGHVLLHPTYHEGNAYSCLEAMASDLPVITTASGIFEDIPLINGAQYLTQVGYTLPIRARPEDFASAVRLACKATVRGGFRGWPRRWTEEHANLTQFGTSWDTFLREVIGAKP